MFKLQVNRMKQILVGINGYGVIGKRVADAIQLQQDMDLIGVVDVATDYRIRTAAVLGVPAPWMTCFGKLMWLLIARQNESLPRTRLDTTRQALNAYSRAVSLTN